MKRIVGSLFLMLVAALPTFSQITSCFEIQQIYVDACGNGQEEGLNEFVVLQTGPNLLNVADMQVAFPNNAWSGVCLNAQSAAKVLELNNQVESCGSFIEPPNGVIPAFSKVYLFTSISFDPSTFSFAGLTENVYAIFHCGTNASGNFANFGTGTRELFISFSNPANCFDQVTYDRALLVDQNGTPGSGNGAYVEFDASGAASYLNNNCSLPNNAISAAWTAPGPICNSVPPINLNSLITGTPGGFWTGQGVTDSIFNPAGLQGSIVITYVVIDGECIAEQQSTITVNSGGNPSWNSPGALCGQELPVSLNTYLTGTPGGTWSGAGVAGGILFPDGLNGPVNITYTVGARNCISSSTQVISFVQTVAGPTVTGGPVFCNGASTQPALTAAGLPGAVFNWYSNAGLTNLISTGPVFNPPAGVNAQYFVTQEFSGCNVISTPVNVSFIDQPSAPVVPASVEYCPGSPIPPITATASAPVTWYNNQALTQQVGTGLTFTPLESMAPDIWVQSGSGSCRSEAVQILLNAANLSASWTAPSSLCSNAEPIDLNALITGSSGGTWSGNGVNGAQFNPSGLSGNIVITYVVGSGDCLVESQQTITVNQGGDPAWTSPGALCNQTEPLNLNDWITGTTGGTWSGQGVAGSIFFPDGINGPVNFTYTVGTGNCIGTLSQVVNVISAVSPPSVSGNTTVCEGAEVVLTASVLQGAEVTWYTDAALTNPVNTGITFEPVSGQTATYYVTQGFPGCVSVATPVTVTVTDAPEAPVTLATVAYCEGEPIPQLSAASAANILWFNDAALTEQVGTGSTFTPTSGQLPDIYVIASLGSDCSSEAVAITVNETPAAFAEIVNSAPLETCDFAPVVLGSVSSGSILWSTGETTESITITNPGTYILTATGCNTVSDTITFISNAVIADFSLSAEDGIAPLTVTAVSNSQNADNCIWYLNNEEGAIDSNVPFTLNEEGEYTVRLVCSNNEGCSDELIRTISVVSGVLTVSIPNSFTPNGDGFNDNFKPTIKGMQDLSFTIFNRWGNQIYTWTDPQGVWDGFANGNPSPDGVYFYVMKGVDLSGKTVERSGSITVRR